MKVTGFVLSLILIFIFINSAIAFDCSTYPSAKEIDVKVSASVGIDEDKFVYNYTLYSSTKSKQDVWNFLVDNLSDISSVTSPNGWGGSRRYNRQPYMWGSHFPETNIKPGDYLGGFSIKSSGLPLIITYYARGWYPPVELPDSEIPEDACPEQDILVNSVKGKTLGPTAPPADFKPLEFLDYIIGLKHEAVSLGWITNKGIENSLDAKLDSAKKKLEQDNATSAKNILNAFLKEVEAQGCKNYDKCPKGKHLTSEAYALLKHNAQYLIEQLGGE